eukprot:6198269-Pleurochrysis_carterae.AAC.2
MAFMHICTYSKDSSFVDPIGMRTALSEENRRAQCTTDESACTDKSIGSADAFGAGGGATSGTVTPVSIDVWHVFDERDHGAEEREEGDGRETAPALRRHAAGSGRQRALEDGERRVHEEAPVDERTAHRHNAKGGEQRETLQPKRWERVDRP